MAKVRVKDNGCWEWTGAITSTPPGAPYRVGAGYGVFRNAGHHRAHRWSYAHFIGPIPDGLTLDHACHTTDPNCQGGDTCPHRRCVNPEHLEPMTIRRNVLLGSGPPALNALKTHCMHGHEFNEANTRWYSNGTMRNCRACAREQARKRRDRANPNRFRRQSPSWVLEQNA